VFMPAKAGPKARKNSSKVPIGSLLLVKAAGHP
jgi:hypothetical protein